MLRDSDKTTGDVPRVCSVVLAFGNPNDLMQCLETLQAQVAIEHHIALIQNGAAEQTLDRIALEFPRVHLIRNGANAGAAAGRNLGMRWAAQLKPDYLFFGDNDATFAPDAIHQLVGAAQANPDAAIFGAVIYQKFESEKIFGAGAFFRPPFFDEHVVAIDPSVPCFPVDFIGTGAMLVRAGAALELENFDEGLIVYFEDTDWCLRARRLGLQTMVVTQAAAFHDVPRGKFNPRHIYYTTRNRLVVARRHAMFNSITDKRVLAWLMERSWKMFIADEEIAWTCLIAYWIAVWHYLLHRLGRCPKWMETPRDNLTEARVRRYLWSTPFWRAGRGLKRVISRGLRPKMGWSG